MHVYTVLSPHRKHKLGEFSHQIAVFVLAHKSNVFSVVVQWVMIYCFLRNHPDKFVN